MFYMVDVFIVVCSAGTQRVAVIWAHLERFCGSKILPVNIFRKWKIPSLTSIPYAGAAQTKKVQFSSVQSLSYVWLFATPWTAACQASQSITSSWNLLKFMSIRSVMWSNHLILCCSLLLLPSIFPSIRVFSNESVLRIRWKKYWSFSFSISPSSEYSGLISSRMDWFDLAVQGTLKSLLQHHSSKASILRDSAFFTVQLSHLCVTTGKTIALTRWTVVSKVMSLLFSMLSRLVIAFPPRSKRLLISWLQSPYAEILEPPKIKSVTVSIVSHLFAMNWWDQMPWY